MPFYNLIYRDVGIATASSLKNIVTEKICPCFAILGESKSRSNNQPSSKKAAAHGLWGK